MFNQVAAFYFDVLVAHRGVLELSSEEALTALETLTHTTKDNPHPVMPLASAIPADIPAMFRRAALHAALGAARSFYSHLEQWRKQKAKAQAKSILLKLWTGSSWAWIKCGIQGRELPGAWDVESPTLVQDGQHWNLHTAVQKKFASPGKVGHQLSTNQAARMCAVDLNITTHLAVCTILTVEGTVVATRFIKGGKQLHGLRKRQLGRIARNRSKTGIIAAGEQDNMALWTKIRALDEESAHQVSHRIVEFAKEHQASILVFEHLGHFKPHKGKYSKRGNEKRSYWLRGKIFKYSKYKAWNEGIVTCRVSPRNTSRECARCGGLVARYEAGKPAEGYTPGAPLVYCPQCFMHGNSDRNASIVIGKRLLARYQQTPSQEKPQAPLVPERPVKTGGVRRSQDAKGSGRPSTDLARHGTVNAQGTAQDTLTGMVESVSGIVRPLRVCNES